MKSFKTVISDNSNYKTLINAVINRIGVSSVQDVINHGIDGGFSGFIYYADTHRFAMRHRNDIVRMLKDTADMLGEDVVTMVGNFGVFRRSKMDSDDQQQLYNYIGGGKCEQGTITNVIAWFAAEEVCRMFED